MTTRGSSFFGDSTASADGLARESSEDLVEGVAVDDRLSTLGPCISLGSTYTASKAAI